MVFAQQNMTLSWGMHAHEARHENVNICKYSGQSLLMMLKEVFTVDNSEACGLEGRYLLPTQVSSIRLPIVKTR